MELPEKELIKLFAINILSEAVPLLYLAYIPRIEDEPEYKIILLLINFEPLMQELKFS